MAIFNYPYRKSINLPAWILQIIICLIMIAASAFVMSIVNDGDYQQYLHGYSGLFTTAAGVQIAITAVTIVLDIVEMVLIGRRRMQPALYLSSACVKTLIWCIIFILNLIAVSVLAIILSAILAGTSVLQLVYGATLVHRKRRGTLRGGNYAPAVNPANGGHVVVEEGHPITYDGPVPTYGNEPGYYHAQPHQGTEYKSPMASPYAYSQPVPATQAPGSYELDNRSHY
ncbi:hypothetical protein SLS62_000302 [Diatrype stigma]|uniref:Uncharacterized protein n=1 Tax=Diatrype stigma TaxID=117547 RepID=A0AAN9YXC5_9PEZI